ncbi:hypothetical protein P5673_026003 [Acropora cervicornis]|uniref:Uncharacterized protein n=1 Tax=Acropora cervicornis TaxID=6130 RepID=A0AAD9Q1X5_ACRCE|nr:hypothetical protein P5673_026003 [Acropora cervicornis]
MLLHWKSLVDNNIIANLATDVPAYLAAAYGIVCSSDDEKQESTLKDYIEASKMISVVFVLTFVISPEQEPGDWVGVG